MIAEYKDFRKRTIRRASDGIFRFDILRTLLAEGWYNYIALEVRVVIVHILEESKTLASSGLSMAKDEENIWWSRGSGNFRSHA